MFRPAFTLVLLVLNLLAGATILWLARSDRLRAERDSELQRLLPPDAEELTRIEWSGPALTSAIAIERDASGNWRLPAPDGWPVSPTFMDLMAGLLENPRPRAILPEAAPEEAAAELATYDLDTPEVNLTVHFGPRSDTIRLSGIARTDQPAFALLDSDQRIRVLDPRLLNLLTLDRDQLRDPTLLGINPSEARAISIQFSGGQGLKVRLTRSGADWRFDAPLQARASRARVAEYLEWINSLRPTRFLTETDAAVGEAPEARITLEGNGRQQTLMLYRPAPDGDIVARLEEREPFFLVQAGVREEFSRTVDRLRDRVLLPFEPASLRSIQLSSPERPPLSLQRNESGLWQVVTRVEGEAPVSRAADAQRMAQLISALADARITEFVNDAPSAADLEQYQLTRPQREVTLLTDSGQIVLQIGRPDDSRTGLYARAAGDPFVYKSGYELLAELPVAPQAFRDRTLRPEVAARGQVRLSAEALGTERRVSGLPPATSAEMPLGKLAEAFAPLRARSLVAESFSELIGADGRPLPWTHRITVEPGTGGSGYELLLRKGADGTWTAGSQALGVLFEPEPALTDALEAALAP